MESHPLRRKLKNPDLKSRLNVVSIKIKCVILNAVKNLLLSCNEILRGAYTERSECAQDDRSDIYIKSNTSHFLYRSE